MSKLLLFFILFIGVKCVVAEDRFSAVGFLDSYYATSYNNFESRNRPYFTQASQNDQARLNLAALGGEFINENLHARFVAQYGDSVDINYSAEPNEKIRFIQESYIGFNFTPDTTVDIGTFLAHIGAESWLSKDNYTYSRSLIAEFSPYYETGARFSHRIDNKLTAQFLILNGWQNISERAHPAFGTQLRWEKEGFAVTSNTFFGVEQRGTRYFHDLVLAKTFSGGEALLASIDLGYQDPVAREAGYWWGYSVIGKKPVSHHVSVVTRIESYMDPHGHIVTTSSEMPFRAYSASIGLDYVLTSGLRMRGEIKQLYSTNDIYPSGSAHAGVDTIGVFSLSYAIDREWAC